MIVIGFASAVGLPLGETAAYVGKLEAVRRENYVTWLEFALPAALVKDSWLTVRNRIALFKNGRLLLRATWLLLDWETVWDDGVETVAFRAAVANWILGDSKRGRIVAYASGSSEASKSGEIDAIAKAVVRENMGDLATAARSYGAFFRVANVLTGVTPSTERQFAWKYVRKVLDQLVGEAAENGTVYLYDVFPVDDNPWGVLEFRTAVGLLGVRRKVVFSRENGNATNLRVITRHSDEENAVYVGGSGQGSDRLVESGANELATVDPFARREVFRSETRLSTATALQAVRDSYLESGRPRQTVSFDLQSIGGAQFGIDWDWGDSVAWEAGGLVGRDRVTAVKLAVQNGLETVTAYLSSDFAVRTYGERVDGADVVAANISQSSVINTSGPLPHSGTFSSSGGKILLMASGSGYHTSGADSLIGMTVKLDGTLIGYARVFTNEASSHKAFVPAFIVLSNVGDGTHTVLLEQWSETSSDSNDYFFVAVAEI